jgi:beta-N-acetylhexosaminidase
MRKATLFCASLIFLTILLIPRSADNGRNEIATRSFEWAKAAYQRQELFRCLRYTRWVREAAPESAAPWFLAGHCFYLRRQDSAALFHYNRATALNPGAGALPPFVEMLRRKRGGGAQKLDSTERARLRRMLGQRLLVCVLGRELTGEKKTMIHAGHVGGVVLFGRNIADKKQLRTYIGRIQASSPVPLFIAVDQEGGAVRRLREEHGFGGLPSQAALGATGNPDLAYKFGRLAGRQLREVGANMNLAPVVDVDRRLPLSIITRYHRSLGCDPEKVAALASRIVAGMRQEGVLATAKHFPSQSRVTLDTHREVAVCDTPLRELQDDDLVPYRRLIREGLDAVMISHVVYTQLDPYFPASLSQETVGKLLRGNMGFKGLVVCDDLRMGAIKKQFPLEISVVQAVNAGADLLMVTDSVEGRVLDILVEAAADGRIPRQTVEEGYQRITAMKQKYGLLRQAALPAGTPAAPSARTALVGSVITPNP